MSMTAFARVTKAIIPVVAVAAAAAWVGVPLVVTAQHNGMAGPGTHDDGGVMADMAVIHELVVHHDQITRTVTNLPNGIRTVTESADPALALRIQEHVEKMDQFVTRGVDPNFPPESPAVHGIFRNSAKIQTSIEPTATGVVVVQTSTDPETVALLQQHAAEVTELVKGGMAAMHAAMMKSGRTMAAMQGAGTAEAPAMPSGMTHEQHLDQMKKDAALKQHGDIAMGFDQDKAVHHFILTSDGGAIAVDAKDPADHTTRDEIRAHLGEIAQAFGLGDFQKPVMTHGELPTGASTMQRLKDRIAYRYEQTDHGGAVRITTSDREALDAIHEFLRYQIREHGTGDPFTVQK
jgi:hypothetical protein